MKQFANLDRTDLMLYSVYGPTFTCTATRVPLNVTCEPIAADHPLANYSVYVIDDRLRPVPVGMQEEIYIGGLDVGLGYLNQPGLTSVRFISNVLNKSKDNAQSWKMMHRTDDLGRWLKSGQLLIEGQTDKQIKLRGLRVDFAEVEHIILDVADDKLSQAVVSIRRSLLNNSEFLVAHIVFAEADSNKQHLGVIQSRLSKILPRYMCPAAFVSFDKMPMTNSGKLDRKVIAELLLPSGGNRLEDGEEQSVTLTNTETRLKKFWEKTLVLRRRFTVQTNFFHVGGFFLLLLNLKACTKESFNLDMPLIHMFESSTLGAMARQIDNAFM